MKRLMKLIVPMFVIVCLLFTSSASFAFEKVNNEPPLKVNVFEFCNFAAMPDTDNYMRQWILKNKNIDFDFTYIGEKQQDKMNLMLASGEVPDVCTILTDDISIGIANKWADAGLIVSMDEALKSYPNFQKYGDVKFNKSVYANKKDGKMYMIPGNPAAQPGIATLNLGPIIREDWLKKVGKSVPKTTDELYEVLKLFKQKIGKVDGKSIIPASFNNFRQIFGYTYTHNWYKISPDNKRLDWYFNMPEIQGYTTFMNKLYLDGLLDKEVITQKDDMFFAKLNSGRVGFTYVVIPWLDSANNALRAKDKNARFIPCPIIREKGKPVPNIQASSVAQYTGVTVSKKFASQKGNLDRLMKYLKWNATAEGAFTLQCGPIGVFKELNENTGFWVDTAEVKAEKLQANNTFSQNSGVAYYNLLYYPTKPLKVDMGFSKEVQMAQTVWAEGNQPDNLDFNMAGVGPLWNEKWGGFWGELPKWESKAIYAKSAAECKKITQEMIASMDKNGGRAVANEKLKLYNDFLKKSGK